VATPLDRVFARVDVDHVLRGSSRVSWRLDRHFIDPGPYWFRLETAPQATGDWRVVGVPALNASFLLDPEQRNLGVNPTAHYRVGLTTDQGSYLSPAVSCLGVLDAYHWPKAREVVRQELLLLRSYTGVKGWLFKRRRTGVDAHTRDPETTITDDLGAVVRRRPTTGVPYHGGYFNPIEFSVGLEPGGVDEEVQPNRGPADALTVRRSGRVILVPPLDPRDVFAAADGSGLRYYVRPVKHLALVKGVPVVASAELRQAPFDDPVYDLATP